MIIKSYLYDDVGIKQGALGHIRHHCVETGPLSPRGRRRDKVQGGEEGGECREKEENVERTPVMTSGLTG